MDNIFFWKKWNVPHQRFYIFLFSLFFLSFIFLIIADIARESFVIEWQLIPEIDSVRSAFSSFNQSLINFTLDAENFLIRERYMASPVKVFPSISYTYFLLITIAVITILTVITYLELAFFIIGITVFLLFLATSHTEMIMVFGKEDHRFLIGLILVYAGLGYYFHSFNKSISFFKRMGAFALLTIVTGLVVKFAAKAENPFLHLANFGIVIPIFISIIFFIIISFDIIKAFLFITTDAKNSTSKNNLLSFSAITLLYLLNVLFVYLKKTLVIDWDIVYLSPYYIYIIAATLGIWSYRKRSVLFKDILPFAPTGAYYYLALGIITTSTIAFALITGNDPLAESLEYFIIYTQLCFGIVFFIYVVFNFFELFDKASIYKIVYQPRRAPFFIVRSTGFVAILALFFFSKLFPYYLGLAGYYNSAGDVFSYKQDYETALDFYGKGVQYEFQNHRSNYSYATIAYGKQDYKTAIEYYDRANKKRPFEYAYVNLANTYRQEDMFFPALFKARDGLAKFPESDKLANNLGLLYNKTSLKDSALYYLDLAESFSKQKEVPLNNKMAIFLKEGYYDIADSIGLANENKEHLPFKNNSIALANIFHRKIDGPIQTQYFKDSLLNNSTFPYLYNYGLNRYTEADTFILSTIERLTKVEANEVYSEDLNFIKGLKLWHGGDKAKGKEQLDLLSGKEYVSNENITKITGLLLLKDKAHLSAAPYFKVLHPRGDQDAYFKYCITLLKSNQTEDALFGLRNLRASHDTRISTISTNLVRIFEANKTIALSLSDSLKTQLLYFRSKDFNDQDLAEIYQSISDPALKASATAALMQHYLSRENPQAALAAYKNLDASLKEDEALNFQYLKTLAALSNWEELSKQVSTIALAKEREDYRAYFKGLVAAGQKKTEEAKNLFETTIVRLPFDSEVINNIAGFYNSQNNVFKAYEVLQRSVQHLPEELPILKAYALQSLQMNLDTYAENTLEEIRLLASDKEFRAFKNKFEEVRRQQEGLQDEDIY